MFQKNSGVFFLGIFLFSGSDRSPVFFKNLSTFLLPEFEILRSVRLNRPCWELVLLGKFLTARNEVLLIDYKRVKARVVVIFVFVQALSVEGLHIFMVENKGRFVLEETCSVLLNH